MSKFSIRRASAADAEALARVHHNSIVSAFRGLLSDEYVDWRTPEQFRELWETYFDLAGAVTYLAEDADGKAAGFVAVRPSQDDDSNGWGELDRLYLEQRAWGYGLGAQLLDVGERQLVVDGYTISKLWVFEKNVRAQQLYETRGYVPDLKTKNEHDEVLLRYEKALP